MPKRKQSTNRKASTQDTNGNGSIFEVLREEVLLDAKHNEGRELLGKLSRAKDAKRGMPFFLSVVEYRINDKGEKDGFKARASLPLSKGKPYCQKILKYLETELQAFNEKSYPSVKELEAEADGKEKDAPSRKDAPKGKQTILSTLPPEVIKTLTPAQITAMATTYV